MKELLSFLFYSDLGSDFNNWAMFGFRVLLTIELVRVHGLKKLKSQHQTPNPLHLPEAVNNFISRAATAYLPLLATLGLGTRLVIIPAMVVTSIGYFVIHRKDSLEKRDIPYMYSISLLFLILVGPGTKSLDNWIYQVITP